MSKTLTVKKGDLTGAIPVQYAPEYGFNALVKCPDYMGEFEGEVVDLIGVSECHKCKFFKGLIYGKTNTRLYVHCRRVRARKVKAGV